VHWTILRGYFLLSRDDGTAEQYSSLHNIGMQEYENNDEQNEYENKFL
jgi:hypothetical protein